MPEKQSAVVPQSDQRQRQMSQQQPTMSSPFMMLERFANEMNRMFDQLAFGHRWRRLSNDMTNEMWTPRIEAAQQNNQLVIRAELPGLRKDDVKVDVTEDTITIQGERRQQHEEERGGIYRTERQYGSFYRVIPLPEGAMSDQAKATFKDGVLEITMPAPPDQVTQGRRLEITEGATK